MPRLQVRASFCTLSWPGAFCVVETSFELKDPPASVSQLLRLKVFITMSSFCFLETGSLSEPGSHRFAKVAGHRAGISLPHSPNLSAGVVSVVCGFHVGVGDPCKGPQAYILINGPSPQFKGKEMSL